MSDQPLGREEVARIAIALKGLEQYRETPLDDLIEPAMRFLQSCGKSLEPEDPNSTPLVKWFSRQEAAKFVTGNPRAKRALDQFNRYLEFVSKGGYIRLWDEDAWCSIQYSLLDAEKGPDRFHEWFCNALKEKFGRWQKIELSKAQSVKAKKSKTIACVAFLEPVVMTTQPDGRKTKPSGREFKSDGQKLEPTG